MRKFLKSFKNWRSVRKYLEKQVCEDTIGQIIKAGKDALDSVNEMVMSFTVVKNREQLSEINRVVKKDMTDKSDVQIINRLGKTDDFDIFYGAPAVIMISVKDGTKKITEMCNDIILNVTEKAKSLGLAVNWNSFIKYHYIDKPKNISDINIDKPDDFIPYYAISIGYAS